jgi:hypothetical protein
MSLYHSVPSKASLMTLSADRTISQRPRPDPALPWHHQLVDCWCRPAARRPLNRCCQECWRLNRLILRRCLRPTARAPLACPCWSGYWSCWRRARSLRRPAGRIPRVDRHRHRSHRRPGRRTATSTRDGRPPTMADERRQAITDPLLATISPALAVADPEKRCDSPSTWPGFALCRGLPRSTPRRRRDTDPRRPTGGRVAAASGEDGSELSRQRAGRKSENRVSTLRSGALTSSPVRCASR